MKPTQRKVLETRTRVWQGMKIKYRRIRLADGTITQTRELSNDDAFKLVAASKELKRLKGVGNV